MNYLSRFAKMNMEEQTTTLMRALNINEQEAKEMIEKIVNELQTQELLLQKARSKQHIDDDATLIERLQRMKIKSKNAKNESKNQKFVRLHYFDIKKMREQNYSWQEISKYLAKQHKHKIYYTTLIRIFKTLEQTLNLS
jgi:DNA-directed RNA polymerase beta subunit